MVGYITENKFIISNLAEYIRKLSFGQCGQQFTINLNRFQQIKLDRCMDFNSFLTNFTRIACTNETKIELNFFSATDYERSDNRSDFAIFYYLQTDGKYLCSNQSFKNASMAFEGIKITPFDIFRSFKLFTKIETHTIRYYLSI